MTRRRKVSPRSAVRFLDWKPDYAEVFDLVGDDWQPPFQVKVQPTVRGSTWTAVFTTPLGDRPRVVVRLRHGWSPVADIEVIDRRVLFAWRLSGAQIRAACARETGATMREAP